jgi:hypothetical protein
MIASQLAEGRPRLYLAGISTVLFGMVSFISARKLGQDRAAAWVRARAASEALKRAVYSYLAKASPYDGADRDSPLNSEREKIDEDLTDLQNKITDDSVPGSISAADLTPDDYIAKRVEAQINWLRPKAKKAQDKASFYRLVELILAAATTVITAVVGIAGKDPLGWGFDFVALASVLTTISGAVLAHIEAERYDFTVTQFRAAALRLENALARAQRPFVQPSAEWSDFVAKCEGILADENSSWVAKWSKQANPAKP